ncbi:hypothetical protein EST38_g13132 [Candolleomyces aberdarensis]|uniref:Uncharacterized protein n=1 Tax=Candolleomyces aberdarensis TaxID=2316362 RepID=A0A4Q2D1U5_9AGAR|nr:hypothetical protein EST38_g13132 [Candolleomyces aberdarensis]
MNGVAPIPEVVKGTEGWKGDRDGRAAVVDKDRQRRRPPSPRPSNGGAYWSTTTAHHLHDHRTAVPTGLPLPPLLNGGPCLWLTTSTAVTTTLPNETAHSELLSITMTKDQNQTPGAERVLYGPIRMINHRCKLYNAEVWKKRFIN